MALVVEMLEKFRDMVKAHPYLFAILALVVCVLMGITGAKNSSMAHTCGSAKILNQLSLVASGVGWGVIVVLIVLVVVEFIPGIDLIEDSVLATFLLSNSSGAAFFFAMVIFCTAAMCGTVGTMIWLGCPDSKREDLPLLDMAMGVAVVLAIVVTVVVYLKKHKAMLKHIGSVFTRTKTARSPRSPPSAASSST